MNKKLLAVGVVGAIGWYAWRAFSSAQNYALRADNSEGFSFVSYAGQVVGGLNFGESIGMNTSLVGLAYLKDWEGRKVDKSGLHYVYLDSAGLPTIGYGHLIKKGESFGSITENEAAALLVKDLSESEALVNRGLKIQVHQFMFDAMVIFAYNWPRFASSQCLKKINAKDWQGAFKEWREVVNITVSGKKVLSRGLVNRRENEIKLFTEGLNRL
ncbi:MAG: lysozyme [Methylotenera sp.]|nr:lysozyme [Methylotenera sp.]